MIEPQDKSVDAVPEDDEADLDTAEAARPPSKTKRKEAMHELQAIGERLVELPLAQLVDVPIDDELRAAIREAKRITKHGGHRRQLQYIGRLMRDIDPAPILEWFARLDGVSLEATRALHTPPSAGVSGCSTTMRR